MSERDDAARLRARQDEADSDATRRGGASGGGAPCVVASVTSSPSLAQSFYILAIVDVTGAEVDGGSGTTTPVASSATITALNLGSAIPPVGTLVICTYTSYRWVYRYDG